MKLKDDGVIVTHIATHLGKQAGKFRVEHNLWILLKDKLLPKTCDSRKIAI